MKNIIRDYPNGLRTVVTPLAGAKTVSTHVLFGVGSGKEMTEKQHGISHFLEHLLFSTKRRSDAEIDRTARMNGMEYNACTTEDFTILEGNALPNKTPLLNEIFSDMVYDGDINERFFNKEKNIIYQEIADAKAEMADNAKQIGDKIFYTGTTYDHEILGTNTTLKNIQIDDVLKYKQKHYTPENTVIGFAGNINTKTAGELVEKYWLDRSCSPASADKKLTKNFCKNAFEPVARVGLKNIKHAETYNASIQLPVLDIKQDNLHQDVLTTLIEQKLFTAVREKNSLVYRVKNELIQTNMGGYMGISFSCVPKNIEKCFEVIGQELLKLRKGEITHEDVECATNCLIANEYRRMQDIDEFNSDLIAELQVFGDIETVDDRVKRLKKVNRDEMVENAVMYADAGAATVIACGKDAKQLKPFDYLCID